jgi:hypothetical protein
LRDVEPTTLASESFPFVLPGPSALPASRVGEESSVDGVAHVPFQRAERFLVGLAFGDLAIEVGAALGMRLAELADCDHVDRMVESAVPATRQSVHDPTGRGELDRCGPVVGGVVVAVTESGGVTGLPMRIAARIGPTPNRSVTDVADARTASRIRLCDTFN